MVVRDHSSCRCLTIGRFFWQDPHYYEVGSGEEAEGKHADALQQTLVVEARYEWKPITTLTSGSHYNMCCPLPADTPSAVDMTQAAPNASRSAAENRSTCSLRDTGIVMVDEGCAGDSDGSGISCVAEGYDAAG